MAAMALPFSAMAVEKTAEAAPTKKAAKAKPYPLKTCVVSGEALGGSMGDPYVMTYQGREIKMCCKDCKKDFDKDPAKYLKKLDAAEHAPADKDKKK